MVRPKIERHLNVKDTMTIDGMMYSLCNSLILVIFILMLSIMKSLIIFVEIQCEMLLNNYKRVEENDEMI